MNKIGVLTLFLAVLVGSIGQVILKKGGGVIKELTWSWGNLIIFFKEIVTNFHVLSWVVLGGLSGLLWIVAVSKLDISFATPVALSLGIVLAMVLAQIFLGEQVSLIKWLGAVVIILGILLLASE